MLKLVARIYIILFIYSPLSAQILPFKNYSAKDGLPQSSIRCIFQDSKGFLWFGTYNGISKFNNVKFQNFNIEDDLTSNIINSIYEDSKGNFWVGTAGGLELMVNSRFEKKSVDTEWTNGTKLILKFPVNIETDIENQEGVRDG